MSDLNYQPDNDYYVLFGLEPSATPDDIGKAHKRLAKECHPDLHPDKEWATERFKEVNQVYAVLKDPVAKGEYDRLRWDAMGQSASQDRSRKSGPVKQPKKRGRDLDAERHHKDRMMSYFILGIEVVVMTIFFVLVLYRAITKHKF